ncbi:polyribonucleotide nucleotidyltransferase [Candidatus Marinamargulisbacteria bacterium SCGC AAA071-K20]|nr:polyribonucleotide nucleotidyltransferase [Candidatus Marinamargulisbacteria bacterium SCGC AAA071-K20]
MNHEYISKQTIAGKEITLKTGVMAKQANGSVILECGNNVLLATATMSKKPKEGIDFFPLTIEIAEKMYASGKIPGGFFKREARPSTQSTLLARLIDRPLRPSFPKGFFHDVQIIITTLSFDETIPYDNLAIIAASAAVSVSDIPFNGPVGAATIGYIDKKLVVNPTTEELENSELEIIVSGSKEAILMVESQSSELSEETILEAIILAHEAIKESITLQENLASQAPKVKKTVPGPNPAYEGIKSEVAAFMGTEVEQNLQGGNKEDIEVFLSELSEKVVEKFVDPEGENEGLVKAAFNEIKKQQIRNTIIQKKIRPDGRKTDEIRPIECRTNLLPSVHGSALFTRGETQSLGVVTLGTSVDEQIVDGLADSKKSSYFFHYNFPPYSVGEVGFLRTGRRELGHGALAERALRHVLPADGTFPYTIRIVSEILESNGSSSMASVCSGSLSLMSAGVPIKSSVAGIAMGLLLDENDHTILSDIQGLEDHYGDMDFKVAGTREGITALQLDIKVSGLSKEILQQALSQAKAGRFHILDIMDQSIATPNEELSPNAPKIHNMSIDPEKVGLVIGPGGKMIRKIEEESGATVVVADGNSGLVNISAKNQEKVTIAVNMINGLTKEPEVGEIFAAKVVKIVTFGAFVEYLPGKEGLVHVSKLSDKRIERVEDVLNVGDPMEVKVLSIDDQKRVSLAPTTPVATA